jgi:hypothetical protein
VKFSERFFRTLCELCHIMPGQHLVAERRQHLQIGIHIGCNSPASSAVSCRLWLEACEIRAHLPCLTCFQQRAPAQIRFNSRIWV